MRGSHVLVSLSVDDAVPDRPALRLFIVSVPAAFLFIFFSPVQHVRFSLHFTCSLFRPFPPPDIRIYYPPSPTLEFGLPSSILRLLVPLFSLNLNVH